MSFAFRRRFAGALCALLLAGVLTVPAGAISTSASAAVLMDVDSGRVLYSQNANAKMLIASTTKILTALVAIEHGNLSDVVTVRRDATLAEGSSMYLKEGDHLTLETLLYGLLLCSGNDAAVAIADAVGGSQAKFVAMMNQKAAELGMTRSSFANPNGLDAENHYSTALDMGKLARAAVENETLVRIASTRSITIGGRTMYNHNKLLSMMSGCIGLKTGYTQAAGRTLVSCAVRNGQRLVAVTLQDGNDWADHEQLYEYGFSNYPEKQAVTIGQTVRSVTIKDGFPSTIPLVAAEGFSWPVGNGETLTTEVKLTHALKAPLSAGAVVGQAVFKLSGAEVGRVNVLCGSDVLPQLDSPLDAFRRIPLR